MTGKTWVALLFAGLVITAAEVAVSQAPAERPADEQSGSVKRGADNKPDQEKPVGKEQARLDRYGDPLPTGAVARLGTVRFRAPDEAEGMAFAPDGKTVAVNSRGGLFLFDAASGKRIKRLGDFTFTYRPENAVVFSPDGKRLAARGQVVVGDGKGSRYKGVVRVWELAGDQKPREHDAEQVIWLGWSADGEPLAVCLEKGGVSLRELPAGRSRHFRCENLRVACAFAPAGRILAVDGQNVIHVWDTATGTERFTHRPAKTDYLRSLAVSSDGRHLAVLSQESDSYAAQILDATNGRVLHTVAADQRNPTTLAFDRDGKTLATAGWSGIRCWDVASGRELSRSQGEGANTTVIAFSGDGQTLATLQRHSGAFHLWDVATGKRKTAPVGHTSRPYGAAFSPDARRMASGGGLDGTIVWDLATTKSLFNIHRPSHWVRRVAFSRDGRWLYSTWTDENLWVCDAATGKRQHVIKLEDPDRPDIYQSAISMDLSADGKTLVAFSHNHARKDHGPGYQDTLITGWDPATRKQLFRRRLAGRDPDAVSADARLLAVAFLSGLDESGFEKGPGQGPMRLEDLATGEPLLTFPTLEGQTWPLEFSPDGRLLASNNSNYKRRKESDPTSTGVSLRLWEVATAAEVLSLPLAAGRFRVAAFSPNGRLLARTAPLGDILVWDLAQGRELQRFKGFDAEVTSLAFTPDGRRLISGHTDSTLLVWDVGAPTPPQPGKLEAESLAKAWADLAGSDAPRAFRARWVLASAPETVLPLFKKHLKPAQPADPRRLRALLDDLDSPQFAVRTAAQKGLEELGESAAPALRQAVMKTSSLELRRRAQALLDKLRGPVTRPELLQALRAVAALEDIATPKARMLLEALAQGAPEARLTQDAQASLQRLALRQRQPTPAPAP